MVIGGQAVLLHGEPRLTRDIDVTLGVDSSRLAKVQKTVATIGLSSPVNDVEQFVRTTNVFPVVDHPTGIRIDLIFSFTSYETGAIRRAVGVNFGDVTVRFASVEDLLVHKFVAGRPRDIEDVRGILARNRSVDEGYIHHWLKSFSDVVHRDLVMEFTALKKD